jgi:hypothetical protein
MNTLIWIIQVQSIDTDFELLISVISDFQALILLLFLHQPNNYHLSYPSKEALLAKKNSSPSGENVP